MTRVYLQMIALKRYLIQHVLSFSLKNYMGVAVNRCSVYCVCVQKNTKD